MSAANATATKVPATKAAKPVDRNFTDDDTNFFAIAAAAGNWSEVSEKLQLANTVAAQTRFYQLAIHLPSSASVETII